MSNRIFVPTDYSAQSRDALHVAVDLAEKLSVGVDVVHVWSAPFFGSEYDEVGLTGRHASLFTLIREQATAEMQTYIASVDPPRDLDIETHVLSGDAVHALLEFAAESRPQLTVVGTHGRTGAKYFLLGSVAARLVQLSDVPVLTVPMASDGVAPVLSRVQKILVPVDFSKASASLLSRALALAGVSGAAIELLHVITPPPALLNDMSLWQELATEHAEDVRQSMQTLLDDVAPDSDVPVTTRIEHGLPADIIRGAAQQFGLVVMGTHGRTGLSRLVLGSVAEKVVRASPCPVLTVRLPTTT
jgi:nucleotide-binding universal stress UspA family protein